MASELQAEANKLYRLFRQFSQESKAITIASVGLFVAGLSLLMAFMAMHDANQAKAKVDATTNQQQEYIQTLMDRSDDKWAQAYKELEREKRLLQLKVDEHRAAMLAHGIDPNFHLEGESN